MAIVKQKSSLKKKVENSCKKKCRVDKVISKENHTNLIKSVRAIDSSLLVTEVCSSVEEEFTDSTLNDFIKVFFENDELLLKIVSHHRNSFAALYKKCKPMKYSCMQFQLDWYTWCSAFLLEEQHTLAAIDL